MKNSDQCFEKMVKSKTTTFTSFKKQKAPRPVLANDTNSTVQVYLAMGKEVLAET